MYYKLYNLKTYYKLYNLKTYCKLENKTIFVDKKYIMITKYIFKFSQSTTLKHG